MIADTHRLATKWYGRASGDWWDISEYFSTDACAINNTSSHSLDNAPTTKQYTQHAGTATRAQRRSVPWC